MIKNVKYRKNYLSVDRLTSINSYGEFLSIDDFVKHESEGDQIAKIKEFIIDEDYNEITAVTTLGKSHIDFIYKIIMDDENERLD